MPRVTVGIPVYNGSSLIRECIDNVLRQSFLDIEVVISDNFSTDDTLKICEEFAEKDDRIRILRQSSTSGAIENFIAVRREARSPLFMWRAFDDISSENYIEALVAVHDQDPDIALAAPQIRQDFGSSKPPRTLDFEAAQHGRSARYVINRMRKMKAAWFYGLWKTDAAASAVEEIFQQFPDSWAADYLALFHAVLNGGISGTNDCYFQQRVIADVRDYLPRTKPSFDEMVDRNKRFKATSLSLIERSELSQVEALAVRAYLPLFTNRCSHRSKRVLQALARKVKQKAD